MQITLFRIVLSIVFLLFSVCQYTQADNASDDLYDIKVAALPFLSSAPLFIAEIKDYYRQQGLSVSFHFKKSAQAVAEAVANDEVDIGVTGLTSGFLSLAKQHPLRIIAGQYREEKQYPGSLYIASNEAFQKGLTDIHNLGGEESFGMTTEGSTFHHWFGVTVNKLGLSLSSFNLKPLITVQSMREALAKNQVDLIISSSLVAYRLERHKLGKIIGRVSDYSPGQLGVVFTKQNLIDGQPDKMISFLKAYKTACHDYFSTLIQAPEHEAFVQLIEDINQYLQPKLTLKDAAKSVVYINPDAKYNENELRETILWYQKTGLASYELDIDALFNHDLLDSSH